MPPARYSVDASEADRVRAIASPRRYSHVTLANRPLSRPCVIVAGMTIWAELEREQPAMAARGRELIYRSGDGEGMFVTVRDGVPPRVHPVNAGVVDGHFYTFVQGKSAKRRDLEEDGRYAFHTHLDPSAPSEFLVRGRAIEIHDAELRNSVAKDWFFTVQASYPLYELLVEPVLLGERATANDGPPVYQSWSAGD